MEQSEVSMSSHGGAEDGGMKWNTESVTIIVSVTLFAFFSFLVALVTLCCADPKPVNTSAASEKVGRSPGGGIGGSESEQAEIVVIMAGDDRPTHLAKPASSSTANNLPCD